MDELIELLDDNCVPQLSRKWSSEAEPIGWKQILAQAGLIVDADKSGIPDEQVLSGPQAHLAFLKCDCHFPKFDADAWRAEYMKTVEALPEPMTEIVTEGGKPVKLTIEYQKGKEPFICARIYVPKFVGAELGWFAHSIESDSTFGWKVIMLPRTRDAVIKKFGVTRNFVGVTSIRIINESATKRSFLGDVPELLPSDKI